jgi:hypothetical protein
MHEPNDLPPADAEDGGSFVHPNKEGEVVHDAIVPAHGVGRRTTVQGLYMIARAHDHWIVTYAKNQGLRFFVIESVSGDWPDVHHVLARAIIAHCLGKRLARRLADPFADALGPLEGVSYWKAIAIRQWARAYLEAAAQAKGDYRF